MIKQLVLNIIEISVTTGILITVICALSALLFKHYTARMKHLIWLVLALRLLIPLRLPLVPVNAPVSIPLDNTKMIEIPASFFNAAEQGTDAVITGEQSYDKDSLDNLLPQDQLEVVYRFSLLDVVVAVWLTGVLVSVLYRLSVWQYFNIMLRKTAKKSDTDAPLYTEIQRIKADMGIYKQIDVILWDQAPGRF